MPGKQTPVLEKRAPDDPGLFDGESRVFIKAGLIEVALEAERSLHEQVLSIPRYVGLGRRHSRFRWFSIYRASRYVNVPPKRDWDVESVAGR